MEKPLLIFVGGPYTSVSAVEREKNVNIVHEIVQKLILKGHFVLECHSLEHAFFADGILHHSDFLRQTLNWLKRCDAMFLVAPSPGANLEIQQAKVLGLQIFTNIDDVPSFTDYQNEVIEVEKMFHSINPKAG